MQVGLVPIITSVAVVVVVGTRVRNWRSVGFRLAHRIQLLLVQEELEARRKLALLRLIIRAELLAHLGSVLLEAQVSTVVLEAGAKCSRALAEVVPVMVVWLRIKFLELVHIMEAPGKEQRRKSLERLLVLFIVVVAVVAPQEAELVL